MKRNYQRRKFDPEYPKILAVIQKEQNEVFWQINQDDDNQVNKKELMLPYIKKALSDHEMRLEKYSPEELAEKIYNDLQRYSVLTAPLEDAFVEGISGGIVFYTINEVKIAATIPMTDFGRKSGLC